MTRSGSASEQEVAPRGVVDAVLRALRMIEELASRTEGMRVTEFAELEGINKALAHRALASLVVGGWVAQDPFSSRYRLSGRLLRVAGHLYRSLGLAQVALPILQPLADRTGCHVEITRYFDGSPRVLLVAEPALAATGLRVVSHVGDAQTPYATAAGKVWLAGLGVGELERYLASAELRRITPQTIVDVHTLRMELDSVRRSGVAFNRQEDSDGVFAVAVPIPRNGLPDAYVGSLGLGRPHTTVREEDESVLTQQAREAAKVLAEVIPIWEPIPK